MEAEAEMTAEAPGLVPKDGAPGNMQQALAAIRTPGYCDTRKWQEQQWRANREGCDPRILEFEKAFIAKMRSLEVPMFCVIAMRTVEEQQKLFDDGFSRDRPDDGLWPHMGYAVDIIHSQYGYELSKDQWRIVSHIGKEVAQLRGLHVVHGADWKFYDPAHWELVGWKADARSKANG